MNQMLNEETKEKILNICREIASPMEIVAALLYGSHVCGYADEDSSISVMLIIESQRLTLRWHLEPLEEADLFILTVDRRTFERDVKGDQFGGLLTEGILFPYEPLLNTDYLQEKEVEAKWRIIHEIMSNLISELPEMSHELLIKPEYFMFEMMMRKALVFTPITYSFLNMLRIDLRERNIESVMKGFGRALEMVANEGCIIFHDGYVKITEGYIKSVRKKELHVRNLFRSIPKGMFRHIFRAFPKMMHSFVEDREIYAKHLTDEGESAVTPIFKLEDPKGYIFIPTPLGPVSLSDKITIEDFVRKTVPDGYALKVDVKKVGGVLNTVYMLRFQREEREEKIVVKMFKDWYSWKWFPLALWALGTRGFAVFGKSRLEKEYTINRFLSSNGVNVPKIIYVSPKERLIFQEFIDGTNLTSIIRKMYSPQERDTRLIDIIREVGREIAKVHKLGVTLGDCKPENILVTEDGKIYFVDLEQAEKGGDQAWDIAEFLYYSSLYITVPLGEVPPAEVTQIVTEKFVTAYLEAGGNSENVRKVGSPRYVKVFTFFIPPHLLYIIPNTCKEILKSFKQEEIDG